MSMRDNRLKCFQNSLHANKQVHHYCFHFLAGWIVKCESAIRHERGVK